MLGKLIDYIGRGIGAERRIAQSNDEDIQLVLENSSQGILWIDREGRMSAARSAVLSRWFGAPLAGQRLSDYLDANTPDMKAELDLAWAAVMEGVLPLELTFEQLPRRFSVGSRHYRIDWTPILRDGTLDRALVLISDATSEYELERLQAEQRDVLKILDRVVSDKKGVLAFFEEARDLVDAITDPNGTDVHVLRRAIHKLQGESAMFGVQTIAELCQSLDEQIDELNERPSSEERADLRARWDMLCNSIDALLGADRARTLEIDDEEYEAILHAVLRRESHARVAEMIANWRLEPTRVRLQRLAEQAQSLARRIGKAPIRVHVADSALRLDPDAWSAFWSVFVHVVRNAIEHGLEPNDVRSAAGKSGNGTLDITTRIDGDEFVIELGDDGRGIDWTAVEEQARVKGLPFDTQADLVEALFADGLTTKGDASDLPARGIGLGAVRAACRERGGTMRVHSQPGAGTRVEFRFPREAMHAPVELRQAS
jgi:two-component system chemotaxis sensor kinase CheA